ncbi:hypothetical protein ATCC90586_010066 [Pythium insidiosum]|nr:hypothetical protein ATCC90586_010066 [Pythium insidiosum]
MAAIPYDDANVFLKIRDGVIPSFKIFETEHVFAMLDGFPLVPGHALLIPKAQGYATIMDMPADVAAAVFRELPRLARAVQAATGAPGINILQNNGRSAGQAVFHLHIHVIPRFDGDGLISMPPDHVQLEREAGEAMLARVQAHLTDSSS